MTHQHLSLQCLHSLQGNAHDDDDGGTADSQVTDTGHHIAADDGQQCNDCQVNSAEHNDLVDDLLDEVSGGLAGTEAGDEAAVLLQVVGDLHGVILDGSVEPAEEEDHQEVDESVEPGSVAEEPVIPPLAACSGNTEESADGSGEGADALGEDDGHNTGHAHLDGQVGALAAVDLTAHNALGVLDRDPTLSVVNEDDEQNQGNHNDCNQDCPPTHAKHGAQTGGQRGDDVGKQDHGDAVADTKLIDLLTQPHNHSGTGGESQDDDQAGQEAGLGDDAVVIEHGVESPAHEQTQAHGGAAGDHGQLLLTLLAAFLGHALQGGDGNGQQLDDNRSVDVGLDAQCQDGAVGEGTAGHGIVQAQDGVAQDAIEIAGQSGSIDKGHGHHIADSVQEQNQSGEHELLAELRNLPCVAQGLDHLDHLGLSACLLDLFLGRLGEGRSLNSDLLGQGAVGQDLQTVGAVVDDALLDQSGSVDHSTVLKLVQDSNIDSGQGLCKDVVETTLGNAADQRHLATLETNASLAAGAGVLTLVTTATGLAIAAAMAAALTLAHESGASNGRKFMKLHILTPPYSTSVTSSR